MRVDRGYIFNTGRRLRWQQRTTVEAEGDEVQASLNFFLAFNDASGEGYENRE
ncbi:hypothetical protein LguiB_021800 [Lonicera macranthoides]